MNPLLIKWGSAAVAIILALYFIFSKVYYLGFDAAEVYYLKENAKQQQQMTAKVEDLQSKLVIAAQNLQTNQATMSKDIANISRQLKNQEIVIVKNGKCVPTQTFLDSINQAVDRVNKK